MPNAPMRLGLVDRLCDAGDALETALALAKPLRQQPGRGAREPARHQPVHRCRRRAGLAAQQRGRALVRASDDSREGITAFLEKRAPRWRGRSAGGTGWRAQGFAQGYFRCCRFPVDPMIRALQRTERRAFLERASQRYGDTTMKLKQIAAAALLGGAISPPVRRGRRKRSPFGGRRVSTRPRTTPSSPS